MKLKTLDFIFIILDKTTWIVTSEGKSHFCLRWRYYMWIWRRNGEGKSVFDELKVLRIRVGTIMTVSFLELFPPLCTSFIVPSHYDIFWYNLARDVTFFTTCKGCKLWLVGDKSNTTFTWAHNYHHFYFLPITTCHLNKLWKKVMSVELYSVMTSYFFSLTGCWCWLRFWLFCQYYLVLVFLGCLNWW